MSEPISKKMMEVIDKLYYTPSERATGVMALIDDIRAHLRKMKDPEIPTDWDILCFAVEYIGQQSLVIGDDDFTAHCISVSRWLYAVHYSNPGRIYGQPDRQQDEVDTNETVREAHQDKVPGGNGSGNLPRGVEGYEGNTPVE